MITLYDSIDTSQIPSNAQAVAGYTSGHWVTFPSLAAKFPHAHRLSIAVTAAHDADTLDVETGDATVGDAPGWVKRQHARGVARPCLYASAGVMGPLVEALTAAGIPRSSVRLWSAHYSGQHVCAPGSCGQVSIPMDGTQWTDSAMQRNLDQSLLADDFFGPAGSSGPNWQEAMLNALPVLKQGDSDIAGKPRDVHRMQLLVAGIGTWNNLGASTQIKSDGTFGASTTTALKRAQQFFGLTQDGVCGPMTWAALVTGAA